MLTVHVSLFMLGFSAVKSILWDFVSGEKTWLQLHQWSNYEEYGYKFTDRNLDLTDAKSTLVRIMAWCRQAQCWLSSMPPYGVTGPQWDKRKHRANIVCIFRHCLMVTGGTLPIISVIGVTHGGRMTHISDCRLSHNWFRPSAIWAFGLLLWPRTAINDVMYGLVKYWCIFVLTVRNKVYCYYYYFR